MLSKVLTKDEKQNKHESKIDNKLAFPLNPITKMRITEGKILLLECRVKDM